MIGSTTANVVQRSHPSIGWATLCMPSRPAPVQATTAMNTLRNATQVRTATADRPLTHGYLIRKHGLYTWGRDLDEARRHIEIFEFLLECHGRLMMLTGQLPMSLAND
jgi:ribulose-5-phosphate 4-epimerase/fuculose-1-phosphate aldolase